VSDLSVFIKAGALFLTNQINTIKVSSLSGILASWIDDGEEVEVDGATINPTGATFEGKRLYAQLNVPRRMIEQGGPEFDAYLRSCITAALADKLDATLGGVLASGTYKPQGMGYAITSGMTSKEAAISPDYQDIVNLESSLNDINFPVRDLAFITNARGRGILRNVTNPGGDPIFKDGKLLDYLAYVSNYISSHAGANSDGNLLLWGCWKDLAILQFGGYDIIVDPFTLKKQAKVQLNINAYFDFKGLRGSSPTSPDGSTEANNYAFSFSSLAIK
jgi:HK97 family phage major capsid protein